MVAAGVEDIGPDDAATPPPPASAPKAVEAPEPASFREGIAAASTIAELRTIRDLLLEHYTAETAVDLGEELFARMIELAEAGDLQTIARWLGAFGFDGVRLERLRRAYGEKRAALNAEGVAA